MLYIRIGRRANLKPSPVYALTFVQISTVASRTVIENQIERKGSLWDYKPLSMLWKLNLKVGFQDMLGD
jgi:hypothetical protein